MERRSVTNRLDVTGGHVSGVVIQSGGSVHTGDIKVSKKRRATVVDEITEVRALLDAHAESVPRHAMTDVCLAQIAEQVAKPTKTTRATVGKLWGEIRPELSTLAESVAGLGALGARLAAIDRDINAIE